MLISIFDGVHCNMSIFLAFDIHCVFWFGIQNFTITVVVPALLLLYETLYDVHSQLGLKFNFTQSHRFVEMLIAHFFNPKQLSHVADIDISKFHKSLVEKIFICLSFVCSHNCRDVDML
jgi:hypothetical protein